MQENSLDLTDEHLAHMEEIKKASLQIITELDRINTPGVLLRFGLCPNCLVMFWTLSEMNISHLADFLLGVMLAMQLVEDGTVTIDD